MCINLYADILRNLPIQKHGISFQLLSSYFLSFNKISESPSYTPPIMYSWASLMAQTVKNPPAMQGTPVQFLDCEDPLEEGRATHSSIPAWGIPVTEKPGGLQSMRLQKVRHG